MGPTRPTCSRPSSRRFSPSSRTPSPSYWHVYLDFDNNGTAAVQDIFKPQDLPRPSYVVNTSPGKWQVIWRVEGFAKDEAEQLQRALARETGADPAATDCTRGPERKRQAALTTLVVFF